MTLRGAVLLMLAAVFAPVGHGLSALPVAVPDTARPTFAQTSPLDSYLLPLGPFADGAIPAERLEGRIERRAWRLDNSSQTTLQMLVPLRESLVEAGYDIVFECSDRACGGFDFRVGTEVLPAPDMQVAIRDYRFVSARKGADHAVSLLVSRIRDTGYIQLVSVAPGQPAGTPDPSATPNTPYTRARDAAVEPSPSPETVDADGQAADEAAAVASSGDMADRLLRDGHTILAGLAFAPGGSTLQEGTYPALANLAGFLEEHPDLSVMLVGHTDSVGDLLANIRLSKRRAQAVRTRLIGTYNADPRRIRAEGNGYLSPVASNLTEAGREANRRVEAILLP